MIERTELSVPVELGAAPTRGREPLDRDTLAKSIDAINAVHLMISLHQAMRATPLLPDMLPGIPEMQREEIHAQARALPPERVGPIAAIARNLKILQDMGAQHE